MSAINKELYDALIAAKVSDEVATAAARSVEKADMDTRMAVIEARLAIIEKLQWIIVAGVIGLLIKAFI